MSLNSLMSVGGLFGAAIIALLVLLLHGLFIHLGAKLVKADYSDYENSVMVALASMLLTGVCSFALAASTGWVLLIASALLGAAASWLVIKFAFETSAGRALVVAAFAQVSSNVAAFVLIVLGAALAPLLA